MQAWVVEEPRPVTEGSLRLVELPDPRPGPGQVRVRAEACGVCRTDLHLAAGDLAPRRPHTVPGHEVVGRVDSPRPGLHAARPGRPGRHRLAARDVRTVVAGIHLTDVPPLVFDAAAQTLADLAADADEGAAVLVR